MMWKKKLAAAAVVMAGIGISGVVTATPAEAQTETQTPIPGISGCYMYDYWDFGYWNSGAAGFCIMPMSSDQIFMEFDWNGNYW